MFFISLLESRNKFSNSTINFRLAPLFSVEPSLQARNRKAKYLPRNDEKRKKWVGDGEEEFESLGAPF